MQLPVEQLPSMYEVLNQSATLKKKKRKKRLHDQLLPSSPTHIPSWPELAKKEVKEASISLSDRK